LTIPDDVAAKLFRDPFVRELAALQHGGRFIRFSHPWMALAEKRMLVGMCRHFPQVFEGMKTNDSMERERAARWIDSARCFFWRDRIRDAVSAMPLPPHIVGKPSMPFKLIFISFESETVEVNGKALMSVMIDTREDKLIIVPVSQMTSSGSIAMTYFDVEYGNHWPDTWSATPDAEGVGMVLRMIAFLNSKVATVTQEKAPRAMRRRADREGIAEQQQNETVNVIDLRAYEYEGSGDDDASGSTFHHRWWVRGHIRAQWYPSVKGHRLIYVAPFVKGPADAPFVEQVYDVKR
jgi:hypothetical protein